MSADPSIIKDTCPVKNFQIDLLPYLTGEEIKVLLYVDRHTIGQKDGRNGGLKIRLSIEEIANGRWNRHTGDRFDNGTGMSEPTIRKAIRPLKKYNLIKETAPADHARHVAPEIQLTTEIEEIDTDGLKTRDLVMRYDAIVRSEKARRVRAEKLNKDKNGGSDTTPASDNDGYVNSADSVDINKDTDGSFSCNEVPVIRLGDSATTPENKDTNPGVATQCCRGKADNPGGGSDTMLSGVATHNPYKEETNLETSKKTKKKTISSADKPPREKKKKESKLSDEQKKQHSEMMRALHDRTGKIRDGGAQAEAVEWLLLAGHSPPVCVQCLDWLLSTAKPEYRVSWLNVTKMIGRYLLLKKNGQIGESENGTNQSKFEVDSVKRATTTCDSGRYYEEELERTRAALAAQDRDNQGDPDPQAFTGTTAASGSRARP